MSVDDRTRILYLTRNGLTEPLGYSQVFHYLKELSALWHITVVSFEKKDFEGDKKIFDEVLSELCSRGVVWKRFRYKSGLKTLAIPIAVLCILISIISFEIRWIKKKKIIHCRSYLVCFVAMITNFFGGSRFIFDMRGFWVDELVVSGRVSLGSSIYKILLFLEYKCLENAEHIIVLTHSAKVLLKSRYKEINVDSKTTVIPTCVELNRFPVEHVARPRLPVISIVGTIVSGWAAYQVINELIPLCFELLPGARLEIVTFDDKREVEDVLVEACRQVPRGRISIFSCSPSRIPGIISQHFFSLLLYSGSGSSEIGRSPTRFAEFMASGVPVLTTGQVGDMDHFIDTYGVGVSIGSCSNLRTCVKKIIAYADNQEVRNQCRKLAEENFSLASGVGRINLIYKQL